MNKRAFTATLICLSLLVSVASAAELIGYWQFDKALKIGPRFYFPNLTGTLGDISFGSSVRDAEPTFSEIGVDSLNASVMLDGTKEYLRLPEGLPFGESWSLELWAYPLDINKSGEQFLFGEVAGIIVGLRDGGILYAQSVGEGGIWEYARTTSKVRQGHWLHVLVRYDKENTTLEVLLSQANIKEKLTLEYIPPKKNTNAALGCNPYGTRSQFFKGTMAGAKFYKGLLSDEEFYGSKLE